MDQFLELRNASDYMCQINVVITTKVPYLHTDSDLGIFDCKSVRPSPQMLSVLIGGQSRCRPVYPVDVVQADENDSELDLVLYEENTLPHTVSSVASRH